MSGADPAQCVPAFRSWAIVPAAGASQRMGEPKLLLPWRDGTVLDQVLAQWRASGVAGCLVVLDPHSPARDALEACVRRAGAQVCLPPQSPPDMRSSLLAGLAEWERQGLPAADDVWLTAPADLPLLAPGAIDGLLAAYDPRHPRALAACYQGRRSHPVLVPWSWKQRWERSAAGGGLSQLLAEGPTQDVWLPEHFRRPPDMDTPDQYRAQYDRYGR